MFKCCPVIAIQVTLENFVVAERAFMEVRGHLAAFSYSRNCLSHCQRPSKTLVRTGPP